MTADRKINEIKLWAKNLNKNFPDFQQPKICGYFSIDKNREYVPDSSQLKYYCDPHSKNAHIYFDLNKGIEICVKKPENLDEKLDFLLNFTQRNLHNLHNGNNEKILKADFVCYRGLLTHMMDSIYHYEPWSLLVTNWKGTLYLSEIKKEENYNIPKEKMDMFSSWGYKFEQYMFSENFNSKPDTSTPVYESEEFCVVYSTKLNNKCLLYGAEMDGVITDKPLKEPIQSWEGAEFVEVKTSREISHSKQEYNLKRHKFIKWWAQSFLVGIKKLYCGFRDDKGIVQHVQEYLIRDLARNSCEWEANVAMNLCDRYLEIIKDNIPCSNDPWITWRINWTYKNGDYYIEIFSSDNNILPKWYSDNVIKYS